MRANQTCILMYGHDEHLQVTRRWVLESRGYRVLTMADDSEFATISQNPSVALLLLCHSLTAAERDDTIAVASVRWPGLKVLLLDAANSRAPSGLLGQLLHTMDGPAKLIATVGQLIGTAAPAAALP